MPNSLREVKSRINSTKGTAQITKAMFMVSQSKVKRAEKNYKGYKDFMKRIGDMVSSVVSLAGEDYSHPMLKEREIKKTAYLLITSDKGLAGAYNSNVFKKFEEIISNDKSDFMCGAIGKQGFSYISKKGYKNISDKATYVRDDVMFLDIVPIAKSFIEHYVNGDIDKLVIIYNHYINTLSQETYAKTLLPISDIEGDKIGIEYIYESGIEKTIDTLLPMYIQDVIYGIILDAKTAEHCSRMNSMRNATDNAEEVIDKLQLLYNRARQEMITNELIDIIGGANAIGGGN